LNVECLYLNGKDLGSNPSGMTQVYLSSIYLSIYLSTHTHTHMYIYISICICVCVCVSICVCIYKCIYVCVCIHWKVNFQGISEHPTLLQINLRSGRPASTLISLVSMGRIKLAITGEQTQCLNAQFAHGQSSTSDHLVANQVI